MEIELNKTDAKGYINLFKSDMLETVGINGKNQYCLTVTKKGGKTGIYLKSGTKEWDFPKTNMILPSNAKELNALLELVKEDFKTALDIVKGNTKQEEPEEKDYTKSSSKEENKQFQRQLNNINAKLEQQGEINTQLILLLKKKGK